MNYLEFLSSLAWPVVTVGAIFFLKDPLVGLISGIKTLKIKSGDHELELTRNEATRALEEMLQDVVSLVGDIGIEERKLYESIRAYDGRKSVEDLFPGFVRGSHEHHMLQSLRDRKLIRPFEGSSWKKEKHPVTTRFAAFVEQVAPGILDTKPNKRV